MSYVLVFKLSRFGRNVADVLKSMQLLNDYILLATLVTTLLYHNKNRCILLCISQRGANTYKKYSFSRRKGISADIFSFILFCNGAGKTRAFFGQADVHAIHSIQESTFVVTPSSSKRMALVGQTETHFPQIYCIEVLGNMFTEKFTISFCATGRTEII